MSVASGFRQKHARVRRPAHGFFVIRVNGPRAARTGRKTPGSTRAREGCNPRRWLNCVGEPSETPRGRGSRRRCATDGAREGKARQIESELSTGKHRRSEIEGRGTDKHGRFAVPPSPLYACTYVHPFARVATRLDARLAINEEVVTPPGGEDRKERAKKRN